MQVQGKLSGHSRHFWPALVWAALAIACVSFGWCTPAFPACFDFSTGAPPVTEPLRPLTDQAIPRDESGTLPDGPVWAAVHGVIGQAIDAILKDLLAHRSTKSPRVNKMEIRGVPDPRYLDRQSVSFEVDPFPFVSVKWTETWAFYLSKGTAQRPERIVISYEKVAGTSHISHLCGNYLLKTKGDRMTEVFIYEEAQATGRSQQDTLRGLEGNLQSFRDLK